MMGIPTEEGRGLIPRICEALFAETLGRAKEAFIETNVAGHFEVSHTFTVTYTEIYMEKVKDLLVDNGGPGSSPGSASPTIVASPALRVREHPKLGPYVDGATTVHVHSYEQVLALLELGNRNRRVAATDMNATSSRSHAIFTIRYSKTRQDIDTQAMLEQTSKLNLIDLAGSENANAAGTKGERLKEGGSINKSLLTLGLVIKALAGGHHKLHGSLNSLLGPGKSVVPYRDSCLTFLLRDSLGGNSRTTMLATIRPGRAFYDETVNTLRYADRAKSIVNNAVVNENPLTKKIRSLQEQIELLQRELVAAQDREMAQTVRVQALTADLTQALSCGTLHGTSTLGSTATGVRFAGVDTRMFGQDDEQGRGFYAPAMSPIYSPGGVASPSDMSPRAKTALRALMHDDEEEKKVIEEEEEEKKEDEGKHEPEGDLAVKQETEAQEASTPPQPEAAPEMEPPPAEAASVLTPPSTASTALGFAVTEPASPADVSLSPSISFAGPHKPRRPISSKALRHISGVKDGINQPKSPFQQGRSLLEGFLFKRGQLTGLYKRRWCVVRGSHLLWFLRFGDEESIRGAINLKGYVFEPAPAEEVANGFPYGFVLRKADGDPKARVHTLQASSLEEREKWLETFQLASLLDDGGVDLQEPLRKMLGVAPCTVM